MINPKTGLISPVSDEQDQGSDESGACETRVNQHTLKLFDRMLLSDLKESLAVGV